MISCQVKMYSKLFNRLSVPHANTALTMATTEASIKVLEKLQDTSQRKQLHCCPGMQTLSPIQPRSFTAEQNSQPSTVYPEVIRCFHPSSVSGND